MGSKAWRFGIIDEHHAVTNEHIVSHREQRTEETMGLHAAIVPNLDLCLDLHKGSDHTLIANFAIVEIDEIPNLRVLSHPAVLDQLICSLYIDHDHLASDPESHIKIVPLVRAGMGCEQKRQQKCRGH